MTTLSVIKKIFRLLFVGACLLSSLRMSAMEAREKEEADSTKTIAVNTKEREIDAIRQSQHYGSVDVVKAISTALDEENNEPSSRTPEVEAAPISSELHKRKSEAAFGALEETFETRPLKKATQGSEHFGRQKIKEEVSCFPEWEGDLISEITTLSKKKANVVPSFWERKKKEYEHSYDLLLQKIREKSPALTDLILQEGVSKTQEEQRLFSAKCTPLIEALPELTVFEKQQVVNDVLRAVAFKTAIRGFQAIKIYLYQSERASEDEENVEENIKKLESFCCIPQETIALVQNMTLARNEVSSLSSEDISLLIENEKSGFLSLCYASLCAEKLSEQEIEEAFYNQSQMVYFMTICLGTCYKIHAKAAALRGDCLSEERMNDAANEVEMAANSASRASVVSSAYGHEVANCSLMEVHSRIYLANAKAEGSKEKITNLSAAVAALETASFYFIKANKSTVEEYTRAGHYSLRASKAYSQGEQEQGNKMQMVAKNWSIVACDHSMAVRLEKQGYADSAAKYLLAAIWGVRVAKAHESGNQEAAKKNRLRADSSRLEGIHANMQEFQKRKERDMSKK